MGVVDHGLFTSRALNPKPVLFNSYIYIYAYNVSYVYIYIQLYLQLYTCVHINGRDILNIIYIPNTQDVVYIIYIYVYIYIYVNMYIYRYI